jgi:hypothetical protein
VLVHGIRRELCVWEPVLAPLAQRMDLIAVDLVRLPPFAGAAAAG